MNEISVRNFYSATADVTWLYNISTDAAAAKTGINPPPPTPTEQQLANFWIRAEIVWRWKYADLMIKGRD